MRLLICRSLVVLKRARRKYRADSEYFFQDYRLSTREAITEYSKFAVPRRIKLEGDGKCLRPDCSEPGEDEFFVERIIGRRPRQDKHDGFLWLVKWTG